MPKNIVYFCGQKVFPAVTGGHLHSAGIARALARMGHTVRICSHAGRQEHYLPPRRWLVEEIEPGLSEETYVGLEVGLLQTALRRLGHTRFWQYELIRRGWLPSRLRQRLQAADLVLADFPFTPPPAWVPAGQPWFLVSHNLEHRLMQQGTPRDRAAAARMQAVEAAAPARYRDIFACAEEDQAFFRAHDPQQRLQLPIIRSGVDPKAYQLPAEVRERVRGELGLGPQDRLIVFSGSRSWQNLDVLDDLKAFCRREQAFLEQHHIYLLLLGSMEPQAHREGRMIATGPVPETAPYFAAADAGLNPVTKGSGANVKLFEYLAARLPIISTRFGVRGTALEAGLDYLEYEPEALKPALEQFATARTAAGWRAHAEVVWLRHQRSCDIEALVRDAVSGLAEFQSL